MFFKGGVQDRLALVAQARSVLSGTLMAQGLSAVLAGGNGLTVGMIEAFHRFFLQFVMFCISCLQALV